MITLSLPDVEIKQLMVDKLQRTWKEDLIHTREIGTDWLESKATLALKVPSVVNEDNCNVLINPEHPAFSKIQITGNKEITFDKRFW